MTPWTIACHAPLSMGFPHQEYWRGLTFPPSGNLPGLEIELLSPALAGEFLPLSHQGSPSVTSCCSVSCCSVAKSCLTLCNFMDCCMPGFPVLYYEPCCAGPTKMDGSQWDFWQNVVHWRRERQIISVFLPYEPHKQYEHNSKCL